MPKPLFIFFILLAFSGCAGIETKQESDSFSLINPTPEPLSQWYYDSLSLCLIHGDELETLEIPPINIWDRVREGFALDDVTNKRVQKELSWFTSHPSYLARVSSRAEKYMYYIVNELDKRNMPQELALLPMVESAFDPFAYSRSQASGIWQFIPGTGEMLGLKQNWWYDGRRDITRSTDAALDYLQQLHKQMDGDWLLALASYNSGAGNVRKAMRKNRAKGLPTDYWALDLPRETEAYVPKLMALKLMVEQPESYSASLFNIPNLPYFEVVDVQSQIDIAQAAELAGLTVDDFYILNPGFNRWATDPDGPHNLLVPATIARDFQEKIKNIPDNKKVSWSRYTIKSGDTLSSIAVNHNTTVELLQAINEINGNNIRAGKSLFVPHATAEDSDYTFSLAQRVKRKQSKGSGNKIQYVVRTGDSLWSIAKRYKTTTAKLAKWNGMSPKDPIRPGKQLVVWTKQNNSANSKTVKKVAYKVRNGDSLARIASKFNIRVNDILAWNQVNPKKFLQPGDNLTLFVDVTNLN